MSGQHPRRRTLSRIAVCTGVSLPVLAGCGGGDASSSPEGGDPVRDAKVTMVNLTFKPPGSP